MREIPLNREFAVLASQAEVYDFSVKTERSRLIRCL